ncbi:MAG: alginate export family protein [Gemmatimonadales bacterium]|nr:MAG: alginate export family protein [Gemmatimonadales bacterium]
MKLVRWTLTVAGFLAALLPSAAAAQQLDWQGSIRPRAEAWEEADGETRMFTGMRTRLSLARALSADARLYIEVQDARFWGEALRTTEASADAFDLHQGYFELGHRGVSPLWLRVGRQEMELGEGRLVGAPQWTHQGQSFDGVRGAWTAGSATVVDFFGIQTRESESAALVSDAAFFGVWSRTGLGDDRALELFVLHDRDEGTLSTARTTAGSRYEARAGVVSYRLQAAYQAGEVTALDVGAYMVAARVGAPVLRGRGEVAVSYELYSGDADPNEGETAAFSDLYGKNHPFLGAADLFRDVPGDTNGRGLQDLAMKLGWTVFGEGRLGLDLHRFLTADDEGLSGGTLADEIDLSFRWPVMGGVDLLAGGSWVFLAEAGETLGLAAGDLLFGFVQMSAAF